MNRTIALTLVTALLLAACAPAAEPVTPTLEQNLKNPLFAERYWTELSERMVSLHLAEDPVVKDDRVKAVDNLKDMGVRRAQEATKIRNSGRYAQFLSIGELTEGDVLLLGNMLYLGTGFASYPGGDVRLYLTDVVDPRDVAFPDATAIDLGKLQSPYDAQMYTLSVDEERLKTVLTVVVWDAALKRIHAFAQLPAPVTPVQP